MSSARPRFVNREEILALAREAATRIAEGYPDVRRILLFGSFARADYGARSDLDLLVILKESSKPVSERIADLLKYIPAYPTDIFPLTEAEVEARVAECDPFLRRAVDEGILLWG